MLELTKANLSKSQKMVLQNKAEKENIALDFDPTQYDAVRLYLYAFARGLSPEIKEALEQKAKQTAQQAGVRFQKNRRIGRCLRLYARAHFPGLAPNGHCPGPS
ncbi:MAG: hypothetical protein HC913_09660 [Microscillaceae bacterium]|nr:hypothetical protein [Microscillaceae bacterium]